MSNFAVALVNITDGTVQGHKAGCADLSRGKLRKHADEVWNLEVSSKAEAREAYNADFDEETDGWYDIEWAPCAKHVPAEAEVAEELPTTTVKRGAKWTYLYAADGTLIAELRNDQFEAIAQHLVNGQI